MPDSAQLEKVTGWIAREFALHPVIGIELEFYLAGLSDVFSREEALLVIREGCAAQRLPLTHADAESGAGQCEVAFAPARNVREVVNTITSFKAMLASRLPQGIVADFSAMPYADQPGSGLHVHVHLVDANGVNQFTRDGDNMYSEFSAPLLHSIGGLLELMNPCMLWFAPGEASYARIRPGANAPTTVSWGTNNRTVAIRLPTKAIANKHIEHRVAGSDADVEKVLLGVLLGIYYGLSRACNPGEPVYGDASLAQYGKPRLATSLAEAQRGHQHAAIIADYLHRLQTP